MHFRFPRKRDPSQELNTNDWPAFVGVMRLDGALPLDIRASMLLDQSDSHKRGFCPDCILSQVKSVDFQILTAS